MYDALPAEVRSRARKAYTLFAEDPSHPSLFFKPLRGYDDTWSVRVDRCYRAVCLRDGESLVWLWIGSHSDFDRDFG